MLALAIDTSGDVAGIALGTEETLIAELHFRHKMDLLRRLMPNVRSMISDAGLSVSDLEGMVLSLGPGSFTGLRIGASAAKSLAYALGKPIVGLPTLDVIARGLLPYNGLVCPMIHAKPGEVYAALYALEGTTVRKEMPEAALPVHEVLERLKEHGVGSVLFAGDGARRNTETLATAGVLAPPDHDFPRALTLLRMGIERLSDGDVDDVFSLAPLYVRHPTPEIRLERR